jgi:PPP family 3-phenylpropionic acid transporter
VARPIHLNLSAFYFFYFAYLGAFAPFFALYLTSVGMNAVEIGVLMALPQLTRILAHLWGWLADHTGRRRGADFRRGGDSRISVYLPATVLRLFAVLFAMMFLERGLAAGGSDHAVEGDETARYGRIRVWGSVGFIAAWLRSVI